ncbi:glycosyltransferase [Thermodesulfobacteriota bacterium]
MNKADAAAGPLVSLVVTSYNHAEYLDQRMRSLLAQTYPNIEINVIDDASPDASAEVLDKYKDYPNVRITVLDKNQGYAHATNLGVRLSKGEFVMIAECDDFNDPTHVAVLLEKMLAHPTVGVAFCRSKMVDGNGVVWGDDFVYREQAFKKMCAGGALIEKKMIQKFFLISCVIPNMSAALLKKKYFNLAGGLSPKYRACADWDFWCRIARQCDFYYVAAPLNNFRTHAASVRSTSGIQLPLLEIITLLYGYFSGAALTISERFKFRVNIGIIWSSYASEGFLPWAKSFFVIWRHTLQYEKLSLVYLLFGFLKKIIP